ncbi:MAG: hypothetical protein IJO45_03040 [Oscillospiraceae bacterium]|nr:hypothetical protein [Oscillospiraceae bacterium]
MFGYVMASVKELSYDAKNRYTAVYCGICRQIRERSSQAARLSLSYDMAFLALLLMSLYEPEETTGERACNLHPLKPRPWVDNEYIRYAADMNVYLAYYNALDDYEDERRLLSKAAMGLLKTSCDPIPEQYPRQCAAIEACIARLSQLEQENCPNPDECAACFGQLMGEILVYREDLWAPTLRQLGMALGRYIYLADAAIDYRRDKKKNRYNPFLAMDTGEDWPRWEQYLVMAMGRCTDYYERLPLVQDKDILDNILYSGVWVEYRRRQRALKVPREEVND